MLALMLSLSVPSPDLSLMRSATMYTLAELQSLEGKQISVMVTPISPPWHENGIIITEIEAPRGLSWTIWSAAEINEPTAVSGKVRTIRHRPAVHGGQWFEGFTEVRMRLGQVGNK